MPQAHGAKIMPLGDSITRGTNDINYPNGDIPGGYRKELGNRLAQAEFSYDFVGLKSDNAAPGMDPHHNGHNGFRTDEILDILPSLLTSEPDSVLMMLGTNDMLQNVPVANAASNLGNLIEQITGTVPHCRLYVATVPPITQAWPPEPPNMPAATLNANANLYNTEVRNLVQQHANAGRKVTLVDMSAMLVLTDSDPLMNFYQTGDGIHPGQAGYNQLGTFWFNAITAGGSLADPPVVGLPAAPSGLSVTVASPSRINLSWTDHATDESVYRVRRRNASFGPWEEIAVLPANATSHVVTGLATGVHSYAFAVVAANARGDSPWSNVVSSPEHGDRAHLKPASASSYYNNLAQYAPPKANDGTLTSLWASGGGTNHYWQVDLTNPHHPQKVNVVTRQDTDNPFHRKNFEIRASNDPNFATYTVLGAQGDDPLLFKATLSIEIEDPSPYRYFRVAKTDGASFAITLVNVHAADFVPAPQAPTDLTITALDSTNVRLAWTVPSSSESGFRVERKTGELGEYATVATPAAASTSLTDSSLAAGTTYFYRMLATNETGDSSYSAEFSVTTGTESAYELWSAAYPEFLALPAEDREPAADPNGDGVCNLLAYAFGLDPLLHVTPEQWPRMEAITPNLFYRFRRNKAAPDLECVPQVSTDLTGNYWSALDPAGASVTDIGPGVEEVSVPVLFEGGEIRRFFRVRVVQDVPAP